MHCRKQEALQHALVCKLNSVTTGVRELNGTNQISLATHNSKRKMQGIVSSSKNDIQWTICKQLLVTSIHLQL